MDGVLSWIFKIERSFVFVVCGGGGGVVFDTKVGLQDPTSLKGFWGISHRL